MAEMHIKCRKRDAKPRAPWWFVTSKGGMIRLRIHAAIIRPDSLESFLADLRTGNPSHEFKAVPARKEG